MQTEPSRWIGLQLDGDHKFLRWDRMILCGSNVMDPVEDEEGTADQQEPVKKFRDLYVMGARAVTPVPENGSLMTEPLNILKGLKHKLASGVVQTAQPAKKFKDLYVMGARAVTPEIDDETDSGMPLVAQSLEDPVPQSQPFTEEYEDLYVMGARAMSPTLSSSHDSPGRASAQKTSKDALAEVVENMHDDTVAYLLARRLRVATAAVLKKYLLLEMENDAEYATFVTDFADLDKEQKH